MSEVYKFRKDNIVRYWKYTTLYKIIEVLKNKDENYETIIVSASELKLVEENIKKESKCSLCKDKKFILQRPSRLIGATYLNGENGDECEIPCPSCNKEGR